jgi:hypothetical protein
MRSIRHIFVLGLMALLAVGLAPSVQAQDGPGKICNEHLAEIEQFIEIVLFSALLAPVDITLSHSACVNLAAAIMNDADSGKVAICKIAKDSGFIENNQLGKCVSTLAKLLNEAGPSDWSMVVLAVLIAAWGLRQVYRRRNASLC